MLADFIRVSSIALDLGLDTEDTLPSEQELLKVAIPIRDRNPKLACYHAGIVIANFFSNPKLGCDEMNAGIGSIGMMLDFLEIDAEDSDAD